MCQLSFINTQLGDRTELANKTLALNLMYENSKTGNKDGCGFFAPGCSLFKTKITASLLLNLGVNFKLRKTGANPILAHVRAASVANKETIADAYAHPFDSEHFVLAHNGTLVQKELPKVEVKAEEKPTQTPAAQEPPTQEVPTTPLLEAPKDQAEPKEAAKVEEKKPEKKIDSQIFLEELEKHYTGNVVKDVETTMKLFTGKFALMLWHKPEQKYYIFRGSSATLFKFDIVNAEDKVVGFVVNTELVTGELAVRQALNQLQLQGLNLEACDGKVLTVNTAYRVDGLDLTEVGHVVEEYPTVILTPRVSTHYSESGGWNTRDYSYSARPRDEMINTLCAFMNAADFTISELDEIMYATTGRGILNATTQSLEDFSAFVLRVLAPALTKDKLDVWFSILQWKSKYEIYAKYQSFKFPFMLNDIETLEKVYKEVASA